MISLLRGMKVPVIFFVIFTRFKTELLFTFTLQILSHHKSMATSTVRWLLAPPVQCNKLSHSCLLLVNLNYLQCEATGVLIALILSMQHEVSIRQKCSCEIWNVSCRICRLSTFGNSEIKTQIYQYDNVYIEQQTYVITEKSDWKTIYFIRSMV